ncbi:MAG: aminoacyl--tRNA ligase-related protein, partial [Candidatus Ranarchaeia archaeon]
MPKPTRKKLKEDFLAWFRDILGDSKTVDYRYPVKGAGVWMPYGYKLRGKILEIMRQHHEDTGHQEVLFPLMVNEENFMKEAEHVKGFEDEVYWVTRGGGHELEEKLVLRPTSETSIYPMYNLWIRSHSDLPIIYYQIVNTFRFETKTTRPLIRVREITTFKEAHTVHATKEGAENQVQVAMGVYEKIFNDLGIPFIISQRPDWDKFAGAEYTNAFDLVLPNGRVLQIGTVHMLGQKFAKTFDITFEQKDGATAHVWQTCYGISERIV